MAAPERQLPSTDEPRRKVIIMVAVVAGIAIAGLFYLLMRASGGGTVEPTLENAIRAGAPEFEQYRSRIVLDDPEADEAKRALGDIVMSLHTTARNFTGRTIDGLEVKAAVVDHQGNPVKQRTVVVIPAKQAELQPNKTMLIQVMLDGMTESDDRANIKMETTAFRFKP
ncbi:MAG TPA: hypothetical protein VJ124_19570 [Pyrinomonadaceae bacterium]|nr:hypothetical protein [Pyrinomonadaceae bacterium]